jgi:hypothetical protein
MPHDGFKATCAFRRVPDEQVRGLHYHRCDMVTCAALGNRTQMSSCRTAAFGVDEQVRCADCGLNRMQNLVTIQLTA